MTDLKGLLDDFGVKVSGAVEGEASVEMPEAVLGKVGIGEGAVGIGAGDGYADGMEGGGMGAADRRGEGEGSGTGMVPSAGLGAGERPAEARGEAGGHGADRERREVEAGHDGTRKVDVEWEEEAWAERGGAFGAYLGT